MTLKRKQGHSLFECSGCLTSDKLRVSLASIPIKTVPLKSKAEEAGLYNPSRFQVTTKLHEVSEQFTKETNCSFNKEVRKFICKADVQNKENVIRTVRKDLSLQYGDSSVSR